MKKTILSSLALLISASSALAGQGSGLGVKNESITGASACRPMVRSVIDGWTGVTTYQGIGVTSYTICREYYIGAPKRIRIKYTESDNSPLYSHFRTAADVAGRVCKNQDDEMKTRMNRLSDTPCRGLPMSTEVEELPAEF